MIYTIKYQISPLDGDSIIDGALLVEETSSNEAIKEAIKLIEEEYPDCEILSVECIGGSES